MEHEGSAAEPPAEGQPAAGESPPVDSPPAYEYEIVGAAAPDKPRRSLPVPRISGRAAGRIALVAVPVVIAAAGAWFAAQALTGGGSDDDRLTADVTNVINVFSSGQGAVRRFEGELPDGFPGDIPTYRGAEIISSIAQVSDADVAYLVVYDTKDGRDDVVAALDERLAADPWQVTAGQDARESTVRQFSKIDDPDITGLVLITESEDRGLTTIFLSVQVVSGAEDAGKDAFSPQVSRALPEGYPPEFPQYPDAIVIESAFQRQPQGDNFAVSLITKATGSSVLDFFRGEFEKNGWAVTDGDASGSELAEAAEITFAADNDGVNGNVIAGEFADDENYTRIDIQVQKPK